MEEIQNCRGCLDYAHLVITVVCERLKLKEHVDRKYTNACILKAMVPLSEMFGYSTAIRTLSSGRASYSMEPSHFEQVPQNLVDQIVSDRAK